MAAGNTYTAIATTTLGSAAATITFSSIPATYTDLRIVWVGTMATTTSALKGRFNSDTGANYSYTYISGNGSAASSNYNSSLTSTDFGGMDTNIGLTIPAMVTIDIMSYAGSTYKTYLATGSNDLNGSGVTDRTVGLWRSTSAITSITLMRGGANNIGSGTTATLYGILAA
jgi:hypothetical protein